jgi:hypothetical protein
VKVNTHVRSYFANRPHIHLQTDPTEQLPPGSDGIWTESTSCLLYLTCIFLPKTQMSGKSSIRSDQVLFKPLQFGIHSLYGRKSTCTPANTVLNDLLSVINISTSTSAAIRRDQKQSIWRTFCRYPVCLSATKGVCCNWYGGVDWIHVANEGSSGWLLWAMQRTFWFHESAWNFLINRRRIRSSRETLMHGTGCGTFNSVSLSGQYVKVQIYENLW